MDTISVFVLFLSIVTSALGAVDFTADGLKVEIKNDYVLLQFKESAQLSGVFINGTNILNTNGSIYWELDSSGSSERVFMPNSLHIVEKTSSRVHFYWLQDHNKDYFTVELHYIMEEGLSGVYTYAKFINDKDFRIECKGTEMIYRYNEEDEDDILTQGTKDVFNGTLPNKYDSTGADQVQDTTERLANGTYFKKHDYTDYVSMTGYHGFYGYGSGTFIIPSSQGDGAIDQSFTEYSSGTSDTYVGSGYSCIPAVNTPPGWKQIYGPILIYFPTGNNGDILAAVRKQIQIEEGKVPYKFVSRNIPQKDRSLYRMANF